MPDEVATQETPAESGQVNEPTPEELETEQLPETPEVPEYLTATQAQELLDKQASSFQSWLGRRDKETLSHIGEIIDQRIQSVRPKESDDEYSTRLLEKPREVIRAEIEAFSAERSKKETTHLNKTMESVGGLMESDPLYSDKDLGNEVVEEIKKMIQSGKVGSDLPPASAGKLMLADALSNVFRKRQSKKTNPLSTNKPGGGAANLNAPAAPTKKAKVPKLDEFTQRMAEKWGYKEEDLARLYGEKST